MAAPQRRKKRLRTTFKFFIIVIVLSALLLLQLTRLQSTTNTSDGAISAELSSFRQSKKQSNAVNFTKRVWFDDEGNRITEHITRVPHRPVVNKTTIETADTVAKRKGQYRHKKPPLRKHHQETTSQRGNYRNVSCRDPLVQPSDNSNKIHLKSDVQYLGVLLDAGRHYFPIVWIYRLLDRLELLGFNLLHFRLTDDQAFNMRLDSHPELAQPADGSNGQVYTPTELRQLVEYAKTKSIVIMPEINVPGHAGGWAGSIPRLVVPCAAFICTKGYGLPLNVSHPRLIPILRDVLIEVKDIFSTAPFFHLGGDEVEMSLQCFQELGIAMMDYNKFENDMGIMLLEIGISHDQIVRWEMTGQNKVKTRIKGIDHFWMSRNYQQLSTKLPPPRVFCSQGLYFDTNQDEDGWTIYKYTNSMLKHDYKPIAIIAGAFELGVDYWLDRNLVGRLLAVAIGASNETYTDEQSFIERYQSLCKSLDLPDEMCFKVGAPMISFEDYRADWGITSAGWRKNICSRLAIMESVPVMVSSKRRIDVTLRQANDAFWDHFAQPEADYTSTFEKNTTMQPLVSRSQELQSIAKHTIKHTGIILDLVEDGNSDVNSLQRILAIVDYLGTLGFTMVQLRIMNDNGFALQLSQYDRMSFSQSTSAMVYKPWTINATKRIIRYAALRGIQVMPELTVTHRAGGWFSAAPMAPCPRHYRDRGKGLTLDTTSGTILPILSSVLRELQKVFTSPFVHLGYDERVESTACFNEANMKTNFEKFEYKIARLLKHDGIPLENIIRWENEEQTVYENRTGAITHYRIGMPPPTNTDSNFFISTDLNLHDALSKFETAWDLYQHVQTLTSHKPLGILASVVTIEDLVLKSLNVRQRLLAVAIGLSVDGLSESDFRQVFADLCGAARNKDCQLFGKIPDREAVSESMDNERKQKQNSTFKTRLQHRTVARPREGILVENGTNTYEMAAPLLDW